MGLVIFSDDETDFFPEENKKNVNLFEFSIENKETKKIVKRKNTTKTNKNAINTNNDFNINENLEKNELFKKINEKPKRSYKKRQSKIKE